MSETQGGQNLQGLGLLDLNTLEAWNNGIPQQGKAYFLLGLKQLTFTLLLGRGCLRGGHGSVSFTWLVSSVSQTINYQYFTRNLPALSSFFVNFAETGVSAIISGQKRGTGRVLVALAVPGWNTPSTQKTSC